MPALLERPKMTRAVYESLKRHIMREREKKKQEQEQDAMMERLRKERELKKKKEEEDSLSLEETKEQISQLERKLEGQKILKHQLFNQLKKVLSNQEDTRRKAQQKEQSEMTLSQPAYQHPTLAPAPQPMMMHGRPALYKPTAPPPPLTGMKRQRSPSPTPASSASSYQTYGHSESKYLHTSEGKYPSHNDSKFGHADPKYLPSFAGGKPGHLYTAPHAQPADFKTSAYPQASASHLYATNPSFQQQAAAAAVASPYSSSQSSASKYPGPGQSAFTSYQGHYPQSHPQKALPEQFPAAYPIQRMQQPGYHASLQLQQTLEHAGQKQAAAAAFEDKYKLGQTQIRGMVPPQQPTLISQALQLQQQQSKSTSGFVPGYPARSQAAPPGANYPTSTSASNYTNPSSGQGRPGYGGQSHSRYYQ
ncbi:G protein pathway suppressor 2 [Aplysia californica]|uniref:G protein pathway suppressor 2 n=1 Tax=Aplysia californica TaxID=6500 RepID=A0ABM0K572_APLCA|nr:G protein pathway suppressor 2 [Aplysia californica]